MKIPETPFTLVNWAELPPTIYPGETGRAEWREINLGDLRIRQVAYSPDYVADHWCDRGHILYVLSGELTIELGNGRSFILSPGSSFHVSDYGDAPHRACSRQGALVFIVD
ncbi:DHCW motif cupin fold protein [Rhodoligotrophos ferricapiens]|uniref:DHCW motif cupin fold protein n=1 Tax=Rhodoligotrophos ferricapiens TaxID=3069264 RepID=UPI00315D52F1